MASIKKNSFWGTVFVALGAILGFINAGVLIPNLFTLEENGIYTLLLSYGSVIGQFLCIGLPTVVNRFANNWDDNPGHKKLFYSYFFSTQTLIITALSILALVILVPYIWFYNTNNVNYLIWVPVIIYSLITAYLTILDAFFVAEGKSGFTFLFKDVILRLLLLGLLGFVSLSLLNFNHFIASFLVVHALVGMAGFIYMTYSKKLHPYSFLPLSAMQKKIPSELQLSELKYKSLALISFLSSVGAIGLFNIDSILVEYFLGLDDAGIYGRCATYGILVALPYRVFTKAVSQKIPVELQNNNHENVNSIFRRSVTYLSVLGILIFGSLWVNIDNIFHILPEKYIPGKWVIFFIGLSYVITMLGGVNTTILVFSRYFTWNTIFLLLLLILVVVSDILLIPVYGITGAAAATAGCMLLYNIMIFLFLRKNLNLQPYTFSHLMIIVLGVISYAIASYIDFSFISSFIVQAPVKAAVFSSIYLAFLALTVLKNDFISITKKISGFLKKQR